MNWISSMEFSEEYIEETNAIEILYLHMHIQQNREKENVEHLGKILSSIIRPVSVNVNELLKLTKV